MDESATIGGRLGRYLPWIVLALGIALTMIAWRIMATHEHTEIGWATQLAAESIRADLVEDMEWQRIGLDRLALLWEAADPPQQLWTSNAELYIQHRPGCVAVEWVTDDGDKRIAITKDRSMRTLAFGGLPKEAMQAARISKAPTLSTPEAVGEGHAQYAIAHPVYTNEHFRGFVISFFDVAQSIDENLSDVKDLGFSFAVAIPGIPDHVTPGTNRKYEHTWGRTIAVPLPGVTWHLRVWPSPDALYTIRSVLLDITVVLGIVLSLLAFFTFYFGINVAHASTRTRLANEALYREIAVREGVEKELRRAQDELGTRVQERTVELAESNILLRKKVAEHAEAEESLRELAGRLFRVQDDERRRLARELHDGPTQSLVAVSIDLAVIRDGIPAAETVAQQHLSSCSSMVRQCAEELRTISYLLHPPFLNELGLISTLREFVVGFASRSGIKVTLNIDPELGRFEHPVELTIFRVVQEALSNIHRHTDSPTAAITLLRHSGSIQLEIADAGQGIPAKALAGDAFVHLGVGIASMRERVRQLGGRLEIRSGTAGTTIEVVLPTSQLLAREAVASGSESSATGPIAAA